MPFYPISSSREDAPYLGVRILCNDQHLLLLLDTGSSQTYLRESLSNQVRLKKVAQGRVAPGDGKDARKPINVTSSLRLGDLVLREEPIGFLKDAQFENIPGGQNGGIDGILGATLLKRGEIEFNIPEQVLEIRPFNASRIEESIYSVPLLFVSNANGYAVPLESEDGETLRFLVDTGSNAELVLEENSPLGKLAKDRGSIGTRICRTILGSSDVRVYSLPVRLELKGRTFQENNPVYIRSFGHSPLAGSLGVPTLWASRRVIFNSFLGRAAFEPIETNQPVS